MLILRSGVSARCRPTRAAPAPGPVPLGLAEFGTTTFTLSFFIVGVDPTHTPAVFFGGLIQLIAGAVEFGQ
ncbi:GPR1/FUN34/YaaH family transporter [Streptomyces sp. NBC_01637]|uniref:GPR1/FUN34/YaaH family transporter n=1 Tax=unclassified Streptomyces TaxID=2593676 RepID=UPI00386B963A|nr:acetate uptake transporter family protein [Streptomyces sp. NBC_01653]WTC84538.1 acetate uptake transporter family protein [Streptomyces sp. NBC_01653]WTD86329.1 acetate uptake transporter family protein [Streptomyces sp. NBC_01637]WTD94195.1 acetate uptake transporter family protein [Streptomyces sp. NBC_01637]